jgi:phosphoesterase RecJ-like protein
MRKSPRNGETARRTILRTLEGAGAVLITGHVKPDGDFLGSALGLTRWLESGGRTAVVVSKDGVPAPYGFLAGADRVLKEFPADPAGQTAVVLDTPSPARTGAPSGYFKRAERLINIDHHPDNEGFGDSTLVDPTASSVALLIFEIIAQSARPIDTAAATALYTGLLTDTGGFRFTNTDARTLRAASELAALGARPSETARTVYGSLAPEELRLLGLALSSIETELSGRVSVLTVTDDMRARAGVTEEGIEGLASYGRSVEGTEVAVLIREAGDRVRVSLRSAGSVDVGGVARSLGGGGHRAAAGLVLDGPVAAARERIVSAIGERLSRER